MQDFLQCVLIALTPLRTYGTTAKDYLLLLLGDLFAIPRRSVQ